MPTDALLTNIATKTGIQADKLEKEITLLQVTPALFNLLESNGQKVGLYGGTALNKIYYGKLQRLSYDLDLFCYNYGETVKLLKQNGAKESGRFSETRGAFDFNGVKIDVWNTKKTYEQPQKLRLTSLLSYFDYPAVDSFVPSYTLEFLLAKKIVAMATRSLIRDIYDSWVGLQIVKDRKKFEGYLDKVEREADIDSRAAFRDTIGRNPGYYKDKSVDALNVPSADMMIKDISEMLDVELSKS